ncbi:hypothetical protein MXD81_18380, partial [Microbacteriaceae bacterium K1510]|nr:hypothetical protein [Microbacteriaceae bacterium K1510]
KLVQAIPYKITVAASCVGSGGGGGGGKSGGSSENAARSFLASRINGILLNDPGATSLMNRSNSYVPGNVASAGNGATNVASNAAAFGSAMGLGSG